MATKKRFKEFLSENGFPFLNVYDDEMETLFGHKEKDIIKPSSKKEKEAVKDEDEKALKTNNKLTAYLRYAKNIND